MKRNAQILGSACLLLAVALAGCTTKMDYRSTFVGAQARAAQPYYQGSAVLVTSKESDAQVIKKHPSGMVGAASAISFAAGEYLREIGLEACKRSFAGSATQASEVPVSGGSAFILQPHLAGFEYRLKAPLFGEFDASAQISLKLTCRDSAGTVLMEVEASSGMVKPENVLESDPNTVVNRAVHQAFWLAYRQALASLSTVPQVQPVTPTK